MKLICINCPRGCEMDVTADGGRVSVSGNACPRGADYAEAEVTNPTRMITGLVRVAGMRKPLPVKTKAAVPKAKIDAVLFAMHQATAQLPVRIGDTIVPNIADTGIDLVATANR